MKTVSSLLKRISIPAMVMSLFFVQGCVKTEDNRVTGTIIGFINPVDEAGTALTDKSGVTVSVEGTDLTGLTDVNGRYEISGVPVGSYPVKYTKEFYASYSINRVVFAGGEVPVVIEPTKLYQLSTLTISNIAYSHSYSLGRYSLKISGSITPTTKYRMMAFVGTDSDVSDFHFSKAIQSASYLGVETTSFSVYMSLDGSIYHYGQMLYFVLYLLNIDDDTSYYNSLTGCYMYQSAVKASDVYMITL